MRLKNRKKSAAAIKSMKVGTDELKDLIKGAVKEAMGEEDDTGDDGSDTAAALDGVTAEDMADIIEQAVDTANEKRKSRKDAGEEVGDLTADEVIQEAAEIIDAMTADEGTSEDLRCIREPAPSQTGVRCFRPSPGGLHRCRRPRRCTRPWRGGSMHRRSTCLASSHRSEGREASPAPDRPASWQ